MVFTRTRLLVLAVLLAVLGTIGLTSTVQAAPGDAFDPARPTVFIVQNELSQLQIAEPDAEGNFVFTNEGPVSDLQYNGIGYNIDDNYLYGFVAEGNGTIPTAALVRIGEAGVVTRIGDEVYGIYKVGAIDNGLIYAAVIGEATMYAIDVVTGDVVDEVTLTGSMSSYNEVSDWAFSQGFLWGLGNGRTLVRVDPATGEVSSWTLTDTQIDSGFSGAAWTYADETLGFSHNDTGRVDRISIQNPDADNPVFTLVKSSGGPSSSLNDGAASPGLPVDLALTKTSKGFQPGKSVRYTLEVTNLGDGWSTGWELTDSMPDALSGVFASSDDEGVVCGVVGSDVTCTGGELEPSASATVTVTANVPENFTGKAKNNASVAGNEEDPNLDNNSAAVTDRVDPEEEIVPDNPSVPAGGESTGSSLLSGWTASLLAAMAALGTAVAVRRKVFAG